MNRFADLADAGNRLVPMLGEVMADPQDSLLLAIVPNGVPVGERLADALKLPLIGAYLEREGEPRVTDMPDLTGRHVVVVDDGVETGTAARLVGRAARDAGATHLALAVPVCPRQAEPGLRAVYDEIVAVEHPLARRDLRWHYDDFDIIDEAEARRRLASR